jgi:MFS family permease
MEFGSGILQGWLSPLFSTIGQQYGVSAASLNWVSAAYLLATVLVVPLLSKLGDIYGHKKVLFIATIVVALSSVLVAFAPNYGLFLLGRAIQAPLAVFLPLEFAIVHQRDPENAGRSIGRLVGALTLGAAVGGLLSGVVLDATGSLSATLMVPALFMLLCVIGVKVFVTETELRTQSKVDYLGALLLGGGLVLFLGGLSNMATLSPVIAATAMIVGLALLLGWVVSARKVEQPLIDLRVLLKGGIGLPIVVAFLYGAQMFGSQSPTSVYLRSDPGAQGFGFGATATVAGLVLSLMAAASFVGAAFSDRVARATSGPRAVTLGGVVSAAGYALMILVPASLPVFTVWLVICGLGAGVVIGALPTIVVKRADPDAVGIASGLYNTARTAAGAVSGALFALLMAALADKGTGGASTSTATGFHAVWWICAALCVTFAVVAMFIRDEPGQPAEQESVSPAATGRDDAQLVGEN